MARGQTPSPKNWKHLGYDEVVDLRGATNLQPIIDILVITGSFVHDRPTLTAITRPRSLSARTITIRIPATSDTPNTALYLFAVKMVFCSSRLLSNLSTVKTIAYV